MENVNENWKHLVVRPTLEGGGGASEYDSRQGAPKWYVWCTDIYIFSVETSYTGSSIYKIFLAVSILIHL
jgi:hypothetical protein